MTIERANAYSTLNERAIEDCLRPNRVDCFSIQQNFWIVDSAENMVLWAQNTVELAKLDGAKYYGTFTFQVWNRSDTRKPVLCEPVKPTGRLPRSILHSACALARRVRLLFAHFKRGVKV